MGENEKITGAEYSYCSPKLKQWRLRFCLPQY